MRYEKPQKIESLYEGEGIGVGWLWVMLTQEKVLPDSFYVYQQKKIMKSRF